MEFSCPLSFSFLTKKKSFEPITYILKMLILDTAFMQTTFTLCLDSYSLIVRELERNYG